MVGGASACVFDFHPDFLSLTEIEKREDSFMEYREYEKTNSPSPPPGIGRSEPRARFKEDYDVQ